MLLLCIHLATPCYCLWLNAGWCCSGATPVLFRFNLPVRQQFRSSVPCRFSEIPINLKLFFLSEIALLEKSTTLQPKGGLTVVQGRITGGAGLKKLANGSPQSKDQTNCDPLPCTFGFSFDKPVHPTALRMAHADSPPRFPSHVTVSYKTQSGQWRIVSQFKTTAPAFQRLTDWQLGGLADDTDLSTRQPTKSICDYGHGATKDKANDGKRARRHPSEFHSCPGKSNVKDKKWWAVQLKVNTKNPTVQVFARSCCNKANMAGGKLDIYISDSWALPFIGSNAVKPCLTVTAVDNGTPSGICMGQGNYIFVTTPGRYLQLPEVIVRGPPHLKAELESLATRGHVGKLGKMGKMAMLMDYPLLKHPAGAAQETLRHWANDNRQAGSKHHYLECPHFISKSDVGVWHHLAVTAQGSDPTDGWSAYKDGKELNCHGGSDQFDEPYHADLIGAHSVAHRSKQSGGADKSKYRYFGDFDDIRICA